MARKRHARSGGGGVGCSSRSFRRRAQAIESVNNKTNSRRRVAVSGPQFLGLSDPAVAKELAKLPGYEECRALQLGGRGH
eukprot:scaffold950_cov340-Prasinococcus_capsulatus_cf.AAC.6